MVEQTVYVVETRVYKITKEAPSAAALIREIEEQGADTFVADMDEADGHLDWSESKVRRTSPR